jgi:very-short-patch-repair endonuclease
MTRIYNRQSEKEKRRALRRNMTKAEVLLWLRLKNKQVLGYRFLRQYSVDRYVLDFYCPKLRLAIEVDGESHFVEGAEEYDRERQQYIEALGIKFLRFLNTEIYQNLQGVLQAINEKVTELSAQSVARPHPSTSLSTRSGG